MRLQGAPQGNHWVASTAMGADAAKMRNSYGGLPLFLLLSTALGAFSLLQVGDGRTLLPPSAAAAPCAGCLLSPMPIQLAHMLPTGLPVHSETHSPDEAGRGAAPSFQRGRRRGGQRRTHSQCQHVSSSDFQCALRAHRHNPPVDSHRQRAGPAAAAALPGGAARLAAAGRLPGHLPGCKK